MHQRCACRLRRFDRVVVSAVFALCVAELGAAAEVAGDSFVFELPDAFVDFPAGRADAKTTHAFIDGVRGDADPDIIVLVEQLPGKLSRDAFHDLRIPVNVDASVFDVRWNAYDLKCFEMCQQIGSLPAVAINVQVPLAPNAIQIKVVADESRSEEARRVLEGVLASLQGTVGWSMSERATLVIIGAVMLVLVVAAGVIAALIQSKRNAALDRDVAGAE